MTTENNKSQMGNQYSYGYHKDEVHDETVGSDNNAITFSKVGKGIFHNNDIQQSKGPDRFDRFYRTVYQAIETRPEDPKVTKEELIYIAGNIHKEVLNNNPATYSEIRRWLKQLYALAPDVFQVCVTILTSPNSNLPPDLVREVEEVRESCEPAKQINMPLTVYLERELTEHSFTSDESNRMREDLTQLQTAVNSGNVQPVRQLLFDLTNNLPGLTQPLRQWLVESTEVPIAIRVLARNYLERS